MNHGLSTKKIGQEARCLATELTELTENFFKHRFSAGSLCELGELCGQNFPVHGPNA
jgi:hypothetical protein